MLALLLALLLALATVPARAQTCPDRRDPIHDYVTIDNKRDPGVELYVFCAHQALIASEVAATATCTPMRRPRPSSATPTMRDAAARRSWPRLMSIPSSHPR